MAFKAMNRKLIALAILAIFTTTPVNAAVTFQDSFNSATSLTKKWQANTVGNGGTTTIQGGKLVLETVGGSDGYMGNADAVSVSPKLSSLDLTNKTIEFNIHEVSRKQITGNKDNVSFQLSLQNNNGNSLAIRLIGNYSGYHPDHGGDWNYYNTYNQHTLWISNYGTTENRILKSNLSNSAYYNYFFRVTLSANKVIVGYRTEEQPTYTYKTANVSGYNVLKSLNLGAWSGDGGYTRKNASGKFEVDSFVIYDSIAGCN